MDRFINSFEIDVPSVTADLYDIDPQPNDNYSLLNAHDTDILEEERAQVEPPLSPEFLRMEKARNQIQL
jgi:hypothetical protein